MFRTFILYNILDICIDHMFNEVIFNFEGINKFPSTLEIKQALVKVLAEKRGTIVNSMSVSGLYIIADGVREKLGLDDVYRHRVFNIVRDVLSGLMESITAMNKYSFVDDD